MLVALAVDIWRSLRQRRLVCCASASSVRRARRLCQFGAGAIALNTFWSLYLISAEFINNSRMTVTTTEAAQHLTLSACVYMTHGQWWRLEAFMCTRARKSCLIFNVCCIARVRFGTSSFGACACASFDIGFYVLICILFSQLLYAAAICAHHPPPPSPGGSNFSRRRRRRGRQS